MASKISLRKICLACRYQLRIQNNAVQPTLPPIRSLSNTPSRSSEIDTDPGETVRPRWQQTPKGMTMPFRIRPKLKNNVWRCNNDPRKLDAMYIRFLGEGGDKMLSEEVKWLAVTHKSFDQGRRGFNARLSYFGRRIVELQMSIALVNMSRPPTQNIGQDEYGRYPFDHPALDGLLNLTTPVKADILDKRRLYGLSEKYGLLQVLRWNPKKADNLIGSGLEVVAAQALYSIVGAISLERGGEVANRVVKKKILQPLGIS